MIRAGKTFSQGVLNVLTKYRMAQDLVGCIQSRTVKRLIHS